MDMQAKPIETILRSDALMEQPASNPRIRRIGAAILSILFSAAVCAAPLEVPNGDFSDSANDGTVGGGLIGASGMNVDIGDGPWLGTFNGILALLAPPELTVDSSTQTATLTGLAGGLVGLNALSNGGYFSQTLPSTYQLGRLYILSADLNVGEPIGLDLLGTTNTGIALTSGGSVIASSSTSAPGLVDLALLTGDTYRLRFGHVAGLEAIGNIGVRLFNQPQGLLTLDLLQSVSFSNISMEEREIGPPEDISVVTMGDLLQTPVNEPFGEPIIALVVDNDGDGVPGITVTFTAPDEGASAMLDSPTGGTGPEVTAVTDLDGLATVYATANDQAGCYRVMAESQIGDLDQAMFHLRNYSDDPSQDSIYCNGYQ